MTSAVNEAGPASAGTPAGEYLDVPGGRVRVLHGGAGEPLLFLHAEGGAGQWLEFHQLLARRFSVFAPDHPGFGGSDELPEVEAIDDLVYHYLDVIERLGLERPHVVGASFGGWIAAELAVAAPHAIGSLVLLSAAGLRLPGHPVADPFLMSPGQLLQTAYHDPAKIPPPPSGTGPDAVLAAYRDATALARFSWVPFLCNPKLERRLHRVTARTLVVWPSDDKVIPVAHGHRYAELIPGARFAEVPGSGHAMYAERPAEFAEMTAGFLAGALAEVDCASSEPKGASR
jgi:pimeloyl-ACP methyl ester carboxylesterase